jgi:hypothetical protein
MRINNNAPVFPRFYTETSATFTGDDAAIIEAISARGGIWFERKIGRALVADSISQRRLPDARARIERMVDAGLLVRDRMPLEDGVDIYVDARRA